MKCPRCTPTNSIDMGTQIKGEGADAFEVDNCDKCGGIWLDADELNKMDDNFFVSVEEIAYEPANANESDKSLSCPRCTRQMDKVHPKGFDAIILDNCSECKGFWLDAGELGKMKDVSDEMLVRSLTE